ncbi:MAG TPA: MerR family transcriptional regulator [Chthoniobacterales bacterium]|jgi:DNA-binding transcriptional MerR regulator/methylmalonyl-CoA mutase cobalamin-binding subunit
MSKIFLVDSPIQVASKATGLSQHVLRIWEKRYRAVVPSRSPTGRRYYTPEQIRRLILLRDATKLGHPIGSIANLDDEVLQRLVHPPGTMTAGGRDLMAADTVAALFGENRFVEEAVEAIRSLDGHTLNGILDRAALELGYSGLLRRVISPLAHRLGELWGLGALKTSHEHFASATIRAFLLNPARNYAGEKSAPALVVATPQGQLHELGAVLVAALAAEQGWRPIYLGPSLPATEIAGAAVQNRARAVGLSLVYPEDDPNVSRELRDLRRLLGPTVAILVAGRATASYGNDIEENGALLVHDPAQLQVELARLRAVSA